MATHPPSPSLPVVTYLGFSGPRFLFDPARAGEIDGSAFQAEVHDHLKQRLTRLHGDLGLSERHFLCGISQVAIGADTVFTRVCEELEIPQRIFLPQHRDEYLAAEGSTRPDFTEEEKVVARDLLTRPHIIQIHVVSHASERQQRFRDAQLESVRISDVMVCMVRAGNPGKPGGTPELVQIARKRGRTMLVIEISEHGGRPVFREEWHHRETFVAPQLPHELDEAPPLASPLPGVEEYCAALKMRSSQRADGQRTLFRTAAGIIIGTHILATVCAVLAMTFHGVSHTLVEVILGVELLLLLCGFVVHQYLHHSHASFGWAMSRTIAEIARSVNSMATTPIYMEYLFSLPFPEKLRPLLRTLNVLHLRSSCRHAGVKTWEQRRDEYIEERLLEPGSRGQITYQRGVLKRSSRGLNIARYTFLVCSVTAFLASLSKLGLIAKASEAEHLVSFLGALAIILPTLAVGGLSIAAAFDLEARVHTAEEMLRFLEKQVNHLRLAASQREMERLVVETESRLLAETATWYSRRSFTGVA